MTLHWLDIHDPDAPFPPPEQALDEPNGLLAIGGDLSISRLLTAYRLGIFPWFNPDEPILWWSPDPRCVFRPDAIRISTRLKRRIRRENYAVTLDTAFSQVIHQCAEPRGAQQGTWLGPQMISAYERLHEAGHAHSIEVWQEGELIGGLYGVAIGAVFFGESMFSRQSDGSKLALTWLARQLCDWHFELLDGQVGSAHLFSMGAIEMPRKQFQQTLSEATRRTGRDGRWSFTIDTPGDPQHLPEPAACPAD